MEDETRYELEIVGQRLQKNWVGIGVVVILILALALWNASLLEGSSRLRQNYDLLQAKLDSVTQVQERQLLRERESARRIHELEGLEDEVKTKASVRAVMRLNRRVETLTVTTARLDSVLTSPAEDQIEP